MRRRMIILGHDVALISMLINVPKLEPDGVRYRGFATCRRDRRQQCHPVIESYVSVAVRLIIVSTIRRNGMTRMSRSNGPTDRQARTQKPESAKVQRINVSRVPAEPR